MTLSVFRVETPAYSAYHVASDRSEALDMDFRDAGYESARQAATTLGRDLADLVKDTVVVEVDGATLAKLFVDDPDVNLEEYLDVIEEEGMKGNGTGFEDFDEFVHEIRHAGGAQLKWTELVHEADREVEEAFYPALRVLVEPMLVKAAADAAARHAEDEAEDEAA